MGDEVIHRRVNFTQKEFALLDKVVTNQVTPSPKQRYTELWCTNVPYNCGTQGTMMMSLCALLALGRCHTINARQASFMDKVFLLGVFRASMFPLNGNAEHG